MTFTTVTDLLDRAHALAGELEACGETITEQHWDSFDQTVYRILEELARHRVGAGAYDADALPLHRVVTSYPQPLVPASRDDTVTPRQAAQLLGVSPEHVRRQIHRGAIAAARYPDGYQINLAALALKDVTPAHAGETHPLSRLATTIGATADILVAHRHDPSTPPLQASSATSIARDVLQLASRAARHTLVLCDTEDVDRPMTMARYAARALISLPPSTRVSGLQNPAAGPAATEVRTLNDALDLALHAWAREAYLELRRTVPSLDVVKDISSQAIHIYAALDDVLRRNGRPSFARQHELLVKAAHAAQGAVNVWGPNTTLAPPSKDYTAAARALFTTLDHVVTRDDGDAWDTARVYDSLIRSAQGATWLSAHATALSSALVRSGLVFGRPNSLNHTAERLTSTARGRLVAASGADLPHQASAAEEAATVTRRLLLTLPDQLTAGQTPGIQPTL
ncbi:excisionase family DNA binding protein [Humibacillus xanthopallidus]|uniref:Excisionase family DNA binding protein n=1 Tax=Humibacillus xanthopallidus TaxID=412689 RepID=A0A543PQZ9_9MICO|nr:helix-turn-helix domain-containing protein [Humibacillus xanthopallidus]TQN46506.1 excisionase family DNA binding protein [Humibacillus xanthopallidus]